MSRMFTNIGKPKATGEPKKPININAVVGKSISVVIFLLIVGYALVNLIGFVAKVSANWQEIKFAYNKPTIVKQVRTQYQAKATALDNQFTADNKTASTASPEVSAPSK